MSKMAAGLAATVLLTVGLPAQAMESKPSPVVVSQAAANQLMDMDTAQRQQLQGHWPDAITSYKAILADSNRAPLEQAQAAYQIGRLYRQLRQFTDAIPYLEQAQTLYKEIDSTFGEAETLTELAYIYLLFGRETLATQTLDHAQQLVQPPSDDFNHAATRLQADISRIEGIIASRLEQYDAARDHAKTAIAHYQTLVDAPAPDSPAESILYDRLQVVLQTRNVGLTYFVQNEFDIAWEIITQVINDLEAILLEYQQLENATGTATTQNNLCETFTLIGAAQPALAYCQEALTNFQSLKYGQWVGTILMGISSIYDFTEPADVGVQTEAEAKLRSRTFQEEAIVAMQAANEPWQVAEYQLSLGEDYFFIGQFEQAFELYAQALATYGTLAEEPYAQQLGVSYHIGQAWLQRGDVHYQRGDYATALVDYGQAEKIYTILSQTPLATLEEKRSLGYAYLGLGRTYGRLDRYVDAIASLEKALAIGQEFYEPFIETISLNALADISSELGESSEQESLLAEAEAVDAQRLEYRIGLFNAPPDEDNLSPEERLAQIQASGDYQLEGYAYGQVGATAYDRGEYTKALEALEQAIAIHQKLGDWPAVGSTLDMVAITYNGMEQYDQAIEAFQSALAIHRQVGDRFQTRTTLEGLGNAYLNLGQPELTITFYKEAVNVSESLRTELETLPIARQESYLKSVELLYRSLANLLLEQGRILEAQQVLELLKVQEIRNYIDDQRAADMTIGVTLLPQEEALLTSHGSLVAFGQTLAKCEQDRCGQLSDLRNQRDDLARAYQENIDTLTGFIRKQLADDQALLDPEDLGGQTREILKQQPGTVVIYPLVLEDKLWLLWATEGRVVSRREIPVSRFDLANTVVTFRELLQNPRSDIAALQAPGQQLYRWLIQPIEEELAAGSIENLVFALDRNVRYIPMAALHDGEQYLIEKYGISHILSEELTDWRDRLPTETASVLAAGVSKGTSEFAPLPYVPLELDGIVQEDGEDAEGIYGGTSLLDDAFTFESLRDGLTGQNILHIATHGQFVPGRPEESYLLLGNGERLPIPDIRILGDYLEDVHLAVLSACETGLGGADADGLEIQGMSYYFLDHGVESVLASLWRVSDASTSLLMREMYGNLAAGDVSKTEALRQAQLMWIGSGDELAVDVTRIIGQRVTEEQGSTLLSHPYYWAPFILIGNGL